MYREEYSHYEENEILKLSVQAILGNREEQQDASGYLMLKDGAMVVVCDGMGGHNGGKIASQITVQMFEEKFRNACEDEGVDRIFIKALEDADMSVYGLKNTDGSRMNAGTTVVSVHIAKNELKWLATGDSRIYILRDEELCIANESHTYKWKLDKLLASGLISQEEYMRQLPYGEQLVSYVGTGYVDLEATDVNTSPFVLTKGDRILLTTDGLFKILKDEEIRNILINFRNIREATRALIAKTKRSGEGHLDNVTIALIEIE